jgi:hypothetical protein
VNEAHPQCAFFRTLGLDRTRDFEKYGIRPGNYQFYLEREIERKGEMENTLRCKNETAADKKTDLKPQHLVKVEARMNEIGAMPEGRRDAVYDLVGLMLGSRMSFEEIETTLLPWAAARDGRLGEHVADAIARWMGYMRFRGNYQQGVGSVPFAQNAKAREAPASG